MAALYISLGIVAVIVAIALYCRKNNKQQEKSGKESAAYNRGKTMKEE